MFRDIIHRQFTKQQVDVHFVKLEFQDRHVRVADGDDFRDLRFGLEHVVQLGEEVFALDPVRHDADGVDVAARGVHVQPLRTEWEYFGTVLLYCVNFSIQFA